MERAMQHLSESTKILLSGTSRTNGWDGMGSSCKKIAQATALLLKTVYGAEIRRFFDAAERAREALERSKVMSSQVANHPKEFADSASKAASSLAELANHAKNLASEEEAPLIRKQLNEFADELQAKSDGIIDRANLLLANPTDSNLQTKYADSMVTAQQAVEDMNTPLKNKNIETGVLESNPKNDLKTAQNLMQSLKVTKKKKFSSYSFFN